MFNSQLVGRILIKTFLPFYNHGGIGLILIVSTLITTPQSYAALKLQHSYSTPDNVLVTHTHLELEINFDRKIVAGKATLDVKKLKGNELRLDATDLHITNVTGDSLSWKQIRDEKSKTKGLGEPLIITVAGKKTGDTASITIYYNTIPKANGLAWMDANQTRSGEPFMFALNEPIGARTWFPCQDTPSVRGTYSATLQIVSKNHGKKNPLMALTSGDHNPTEPSPTMLYKHFESRSPIPSYLFVIAAGAFKYHRVSDTIGFYADNEQTLQAARTGLKDVPKYYAALQTILGATPWKSQDFLFLPAMFGYGGMENPGLIYINEALIEDTGAAAYVLAHELAHQWTGNVVTNKTWSDFWLNEAWTSYMEDRALHAVHGPVFAEGNAHMRYLELPAAFQEQQKQTHHPVGVQITQLFKTNVQAEHPDDLLDFAVYSKGATFLKAIASIIGQDAFDHYAQEYVRDFKFKPIDTQTFIEYSTAKLQLIHPALNWKEFFNSWIFTPGVRPEFTDPDLVALNPELGVPNCVDCEKREGEFTQDGDKTNFEKWHAFQISYLLRRISEKLTTDIPMAQRQIQQLMTNQSFMTKITPHVDLLSPWYELLAKADLWEASATAIEQFLTEIGRGRAIKPVYAALMSKPESEKATGFGQKVFKLNEQKYFPSVRSSLVQLFVQ